MDIFGTLCQNLHKSNLLSVIWKYIKKLCVTVKERYVCNDRPCMNGTVSLARTYTAALDGARNFWTLALLHNNVMYRLDAKNDFTEAPPSTAQLLLTMGTIYIHWW